MFFTYLISYSHICIYFSFSNNKLEKCLDFAPKHCHEASAWATGQQAVGSMLTLVDLSANLISNIGDLSSHRFLECLLLSRNQITQINGLNNLRFLQVSYPFFTLKPL